jgi:uncharacterized protein YbjT (DUF2867 family)
MTILIVGATGTLGRQIVRRALDEGHQVRCLVRSPKRATFLKEWGAEVVQGDLLDPASLTAALKEIKVVIDAATARATDSLSIRQVDWEGQVALIQASAAAGIERFIFFSIMDSEKYPAVPLMEVKHCTEVFLQESGLNYTILRPCGFFQGLIGQYAIPLLENQPIWVMGEATPIAYLDTQDVARFAIAALTHPETEGKTFDLAGVKAWTAQDIIGLCESQSRKTARISRMSAGLLRGVRKVVNYFEWGWNVADRLAFTEVLSSGTPLNASMESTYQAFGIDPGSIATLESYMQDYFSRILKKLKELDYDKKASAKRSPFKSSQSSRAN